MEYLNKHGVYYYVYKSNDDLRTLAIKYNTTEKLIFLENNTAEFLDGQILKITKRSGKLYIVRPFETLESIEKKFKSRIKDKNKINFVYPFQMILV